MPQNNQIQGTHQHYLPCVVADRPAPSLVVKKRLRGAPDGCPFCGI